MSAPAATALDERMSGLLRSDVDAIQTAPELWQRLLAEAPVLRLPGITVFSRYGHVKELVNGPSTRYTTQRHRSAYAASIAETLTPEQREAYEGFAEFMSHSIVRGSPEQHLRRRRVVHRAFAPRQLERIEVAVRRFAEELAAELVEGATHDLVGLAYQLPLMVIVDLLGFPQADRERIRAWASAMAGQLDVPTPSTLVEGFRAVHEFREYVDDLLAAQQRTGTASGIVSELLDARHDERLTHEELVTNFILLLVAGHETTSTAISSGVLALLRRPDQWRLLHRRPELAENATEELLRLVTPSQWSTRIALEDHAVNGVEVATGELCIASLAAANLDPEVFTDPATLDIERQNARQHLAFGFGPHFCLGAALARLELTVILGVLSRRFPALELAGDELEYRPPAIVRRLAALRVAVGTPRP